MQTEHAIPSLSQATAEEKAGLPAVSIIIACRNEERFISDCLDSILASDYPMEKVEILVIDGASTDGTRAVVNRYSQKHPFVHLLANPKRITPVAFNMGIEHARGDLIMIMSAHATYEPSAIRRCVSYSSSYGAANVGGMWKIRPRNDGLLADAIVAALSHPFGVGGAAYRTTTSPTVRWVDTAAYGCYRREVFETVGKYNESLIHGQDIELNLRLKKAGFPTLLAPDVVIHYSARTDLSSFLAHSYRDGKWAVLSFAYSTVVPVSGRHLVPLLFVSSLLVSSLIAALGAPLLFLSIVITYLAANALASFAICVKQRRPALFIVLPFVFTLLHISYGLGSLSGCMKLVAVSVAKSSF